LQRDGIEVVKSPANGRNPHEQIYVDHRTHIAISGEALGPSYTAAGIAKTIHPHQHQPRHQQPQQQTRDSSQFNNNVPQLLSAVVHVSLDDEGPNQLGKDQSLGSRRKV
jgi:hypothetical protein